MAIDIKVSVIIPVYNVEKHLPESLDSILNQTLKEIEIICINDGSTDNSLSILREYAGKDGRIIVINQANQGAGAARNRGIEEAKGEFIAFMDADDFYPNEGVLHELYTRAVENGVLICGGSMSSYNDIDASINVEYFGNFAKNTFSKSGRVKYSDYQFDYSYHRFIYNRIFLLNNAIFFRDYRRFQDPPFFVKAMILAREFYAINCISYCYRVHHQKINWEEKKIVGLINGLTDNLLISRENNLHILHRLCLNRYIDEYFKYIKKYPTKTVHKNLIKMRDAIEPEFVDAEEYDQLNQYLSGKFCYPILSITEDAWHKKYCILGIRIKFRKNENFFKQILYVRNEGKYKVLRVFGIKIKLKKRG